MKKVFATATIVALALLMAIPAQAAVSIKKINDSSFASSLANWLIDVLMTNNNNSNDVTNTVSSSANSGNNTHDSSDDQDGSSITTGDAEAVTGVDTLGNQNALGEEYEGSNGPDVTIDDVNDDSTADAETNDELFNEMENNNDTDVDNTVSADGDSGNNAVTSGDSLIDSSTSTGLASGATLVTNEINFNLKSVVRRIMSMIP